MSSPETTVEVHIEVDEDRYAAHFSPAKYQTFREPTVPLLESGGPVKDLCTPRWFRLSGI